eukprot:gene6552-biopygen6267
MGGTARHAGTRPSIHTGEDGSEAWRAVGWGVGRSAVDAAEQQAAQHKSAPTPRGERSTPSAPTTPEAPAQHVSGRAGHRVCAELDVGRPLPMV